MAPYAGPPMLDKLKETLISRKFWATIAGAVMAYFKVDPMIVGIVGAYILGQGIADAGKAAGPKVIAS